ncbi:hypothetical protein NIES2100_78640 [Calothrix sp. NIES-2100]|nr:hypothetical protein NIES2100_37090 [Calothrix sp. NIES-2100]BAY24425.1 hypothetical protein NIES2100_42200 [Calothrix sp. NIES-2100]BAY26505.1 hypothetical protein NIES2100_63210 [Calothrix sp. NIES-2100]BAY28035.1 hypothetical protein NIES2100_78640 [Calothrix sp. NIES-2100]
MLAFLSQALQRKYQVVESIYIPRLLAPTNYQSANHK